MSEDHDTCVHRNKRPTGLRGHQSYRVLSNAYQQPHHRINTNQQWPKKAVLYPYQCVVYWYMSSNLFIILTLHPGNHEIYKFGRPSLIITTDACHYSFIFDMYSMTGYLVFPQWFVGYILSLSDLCLGVL